MQECDEVEPSLATCSGANII